MTTKYGFRNIIKEAYGPMYSNKEKVILQFLMQIKPAGQSNQNEVYRVRGETLLKIKYLMQNNELNTATNESDKILRAKKSGSK